MQWLSRFTLMSLFLLLMGGCTHLIPVHHPGQMDHSAMTKDHMSQMDHGAMAKEHLGQMDHRAMISQTATLTATAMGGMDHSMMNVDPSKPFDAQFIDSMIEHHQGAVVMAEQALEQAEHAELRTLAEAIIAAQTQEIEQMTAWRQSWYPDLAPTGGMGMDMGEMALSTDESKSFDQRFIEAMLSHHRGAITMAQMAQHMAEQAEIKTLADAIITAQQAEIGQMQKWLQEWFDRADATSPYVEQMASPVRGLSAQEVDDLRTGRGMGFARMAELNSYPGPRHVLDLQQELHLSAEQVAAIDAIFGAMEEQAQSLGQQILTLEEQLSTAFASGEIDDEALQTQIMTLADLYGQLRLTHLRAHLQVTPLLTPEQIATYNQLRGYLGDGEHSHMH